MESASLCESCMYSGFQCYCDCTTIYPKPGTTLVLTLGRCQFSFYLGQLSFALSTPIPLSLELANDMAANISIDVRLVRTVTTHSATSDVRQLDIARTAFWPALRSSARRIKLWGEVIAGRSLTPSFVFSKCSVQVCALSLCVLMPMDMSSWHIAVFDCALS